QGVAVVGIATTGDEAVSLMERHAPDVMLVDIDLGPESGLDLARRLVESRRGGAAARVILVSAHDEADYAHLISASPAIGLLAKSELSAPAIRRLLGQPGDGRP